MNDEKFIVKSGDTKYAGLKVEGHISPSSDHKFIEFSDKPIKGANTEAGFIVIEHFLEIKQSRTKWYKDRKEYVVSWMNHKEVKVLSIPMNYLIIAEGIRNKGKLIPKDFGLPDLECYWLDKSVEISINFHYFDKNSKEAITIKDGTPSKQFGESYPIKPQLDREGHVFTTFQPQLIRRIIQNRTTLIENSNNALHYDWVLDLRTIINDTISLIEITLNQIYIKAQYDLPMGWTFDTNIVGQKHGRRLNDKLKWVKQISGNDLNIENERKSLDELREVRNHFNHFDPPSLVVTIEEATKWINQVIDIGFILIKIRKAMGLQISTHLVNFILQKEAIFNPEPAFKQRLPLDSEKSGYYSSTW